VSGDDRPPVLPGSPSGAAEAATALRAGAVVAIPTDTVYGLAAALDQPAAIDRLYAIKHRPHDKPIPVLIDNIANAGLVSSRLPQLARALAASFWPGALTLVVPAVAGLHPGLTAVDLEHGLTVAIRVPAHQLAREVIASAGGALAVTSANISGERPAVAVEELAQLGQTAPDLILDGGRTPGGIASTVVLATGDEPEISREGAIPAAAIFAALRARDRTDERDEARLGSGV
jgi:L-threonylcarbamoyladenylate synthase